MPRTVQDLRSASGKPFSRQRYQFQELPICGFAGGPTGVPPHGPPRTTPSCAEDVHAASPTVSRRLHVAQCMGSVRSSASPRASGAAAAMRAPPAKMERAAKETNRRRVAESRVIMWSVLPEWSLEPPGDDFKRRGAAVVDEVAHSRQAPLDAAGRQNHVRVVHGESLGAAVDHVESNPDGLRPAGEERILLHSEEES